MKKVFFFFVFFGMCCFLKSAVAFESKPFSQGAYNEMEKAQREEQLEQERLMRMYQYQRLLEKEREEQAQKERERLRTPPPSPEPVSCGIIVNG